MSELLKRERPKTAVKVPPEKDAPQIKDAPPTKGAPPKGALPTKDARPKKDALQINGAPPKGALSTKDARPKKDALPTNDAPPKKISNISETGPKVPFMNKFRRSSGIPDINFSVFIYIIFVLVIALIVYGFVSFYSTYEDCRKKENTLSPGSMCFMIPCFYETQQKSCDSCSFGYVLNENQSGYECGSLLEGDTETSPETSNTGGDEETRPTPTLQPQPKTQPEPEPPQP